MDKKIHQTINDMKICVRAHDVDHTTPQILAKKIKELGFDGLQLAINKAIEGETALPNSMSLDRLKEISQAFKNEGLIVPLMGAYFNPIHSNPQKLDMFKEKFIEHLNFADLFGCSYIGSETGSYYSDDQWKLDPRNLSDTALYRVRDAFADLAFAARSTSAKVAIEGAAHHCIYHPKQLKRLLDLLDDAHVYAILDVFNYLTMSHYDQSYQREIIDASFDLLSAKIKIIHLKDFIVSEGNFKKVGLGEGLMDLPYLMDKIKKYCPDAFLIFEGVEYPYLASSLKYIKGLLKG